MELFVVNRHVGDDEDDQRNESQENETSKLKKVLKRIEKNKRNRHKQKEREKKIKLAKQKTLESRQFKRELRAKIIPVPENANDDFIDNSILEDSTKTVVNGAPNESKDNKKRKLEPRSVEGFTVLGADNFTKKQKVKRVLPKWLANPTVISSNLQELHTKVSDIKFLDKLIRKLLKANDIKYFFPVQSEVIPYLLKSNKQSDVIFPSDICVSAPTGSGKTLAYVLPVIHALKKHTVKKVRALVILPTQDLATQVFKAFRTYSQNMNIDVGLITGNHPFHVEQSQLVTENVAFGTLSKIDILVCTAGRLVDHIKLTEGFDLHNLEFLIIDEADRVLENIQNDWLYHLEKHISEEESDPQTGRVLNLFTLQKKRPPQKLLFSATLSQDPEKLQKLSLFQPKLFTSVVDDPKATTETENMDGETFIGKYTTPQELTEKYVITSLDLKPLLLYRFIKEEKLTKSIIFTHSAESAHRLAILLRAMFKDELKVDEISSNLLGKNRTTLIDKFSNSDIDLLVCTDALARGIDLPHVQCVISYSAPKHLKTYIHRAGRTARAGEQGLTVTLLHKSQLSKFNSMLQQAGKTNVQELVISEEDLEPLGEQYKQSLQELKKVVEKEEELQLKKVISAKGRGRVKRKRKESVGSTVSSVNKDR